MGVRCQLCGISFNASRIRAVDEPIDAAWSELAGTFVSNSDCVDPCEAEGCSDILRTRYSVTKEHLAGPDCTCVLGYRSSRISAQEMRHSTAVQCLSAKLPDWQSEAGDEDFEVAAKHCFLTGTSLHGVDEWEVDGLLPLKHDLAGTIPISNDTDHGDETSLSKSAAMPIHPKCFGLFKRLSCQYLGKVDIDGLWRLREDKGLTGFRFHEVPKCSDVDSVMDDPWYHCEPGTEYLVSDPVEIPGMTALLCACISEDSNISNFVFAAPANGSSEFDPFSRLPFELCQLITNYLSRADVASMRSVSKCFTQLPQSYFRRLVRNEMPWVWELDRVEKSKVDWFKLWRRLSAADGGACADEQERKWLRRIRRKWDDRLHRILESEGETPMKSTYFEQWRSRSDGAKHKAEAEIKAGYESGMWPPKRDQVLLGLRNRRRIWQDVEWIVRRIGGLPDDMDGGQYAAGPARGKANVHVAAVTRISPTGL